MHNRPRWTLIHARLHRTLRQRRLLPKQQRVLMAVSGGQDSLCLAKLLLDLQPKWEWQLAIAHCDHRWAADVGLAEHVRQVAQSLGLPFYLKTAVEISKGEAAARQWRYQALGEVAKTNGYQSLVTAHTKSDLAETLLYNLIRGAGADGLQALTWQRQLTNELKLVRPLLEISRSETSMFCQENHLEVWEDFYNQDLRYARNRIRKEVLPYLESHFNPQVETALSQTAELLRADVEYLEAQAYQLLQQAILPIRSAEQDNMERTSDTAKILRLNRYVLQQAPLSLQRRAIRQFLQKVQKSASNFEQIEAMIVLITAPNRSQTSSFPQGARAFVEGDWIIFQVEGN
ncbi:MAG: tRNA lysidine(34) synthetase TilS [Coleofasciculaceae cyanobacterium]